MSQANEAERLRALRQLNLLDTPPSESIDRITRMASRLFDLPFAAVSLTDTDRQWFKSRVGIEQASAPRDKAPCAEIANGAIPLAIPDLLAHPVYRNSSLAHDGVRFYAGAPLMTNQGYCLGALCVLGMAVRQTSPAEMAMLGDLAAMVMAQIELQHAFGRIDPVSLLPNRAQFLDDMEDLARDGLFDRKRYLVLIDIASPGQVSEAVRVVGPGHIENLVVEAAQRIMGRLGAGRRAYHVAATQIVFLSALHVEERTYMATLEAAVGLLHSSISSRLQTIAAIGVVPCGAGVASVDLLRMAHSAAQDARASDTKVSLYSQGADERHRRRFSIIHDFADALAAPDQLRLVYQPRVDIASGACLGAEALLRWRHPDLGDISPGEFIPIIEHTNLARDTTAWVLEAAVRQAAAWASIGVTLQLSVNISAANLEEADFADRLRAILGRHGVPLSRLELEVTESAMMNDTGRAMALLTRLSRLGIDLAIDDFGTGYSSLAYLQRLPAQVVKIDKSFMIGLAGDERKQALVRTMITLSHNLGYRVVAEGVEDRAALSLLLGGGCDEAQGYLFARPMAPAEFISWLNRDASLPPSSRQHALLISEIGD